MSKDPKKPDEATKSESDDAADADAESQGELDDLELKEVTGGAAAPWRKYFNE